MVCVIVPIIHMPSSFSLHLADVLLFPSGFPSDAAAAAAAKKRFIIMNRSNGTESVHLQ